MVGFSTRPKAGSEPIQHCRADTTQSDESSPRILQRPIAGRRILAVGLWHLPRCGDCWRRLRDAARAGSSRTSEQGVRAPDEAIPSFRHGECARHLASPKREHDSLAAPLSTERGRRAACLLGGSGMCRVFGVEPYRIEVPDGELVRLRLRLADARWPDRETVEDWSQGVPLQVVRDLCDYWGSGYDWRAAEERVNRWPQYLAVIDGVPIHLFHLPSLSRSAVPLILTHGWPGSFFEFEQVMAQLSDPAASGKPESPAFHVVVPSLPGYGFSGKPTTGWDVPRIARAWVEVMRRLGYDRFIAAGSDWGTSVSTSIGLQQPERLLGLHLVPPLVPAVPADGTSLTAPERAALAELEERSRIASAYSAVQRTRPQTIGYSLVDSPGRAVRLDSGEGLDLVRPCRRPLQRALSRPGPRRHHALLADRHRRFGGAALLGEHRAGQAAGSPIPSRTPSQSRPDAPSSRVRYRGPRDASPSSALPTSCTGANRSEAGTSAPGSNPTGS